MNGDLYQIWVYLSASPLFGLTLTVLAYLVGVEAHRRSGQHPLVNPVLVAIVLVAGVLALTGTDYRTYFDGAQFVHFLLGPATVALAVPLHRALPQVRRAALPILVAVGVGAVTAIATAMAIPAALGASAPTVVSMAPKSVTAPVAMGLSEQFGGVPTLTAVFTILTGITGAVVARGALDLLRIRDWRVRGLAVGVAAHGLGTARALQVHPTAGAFAGLGLALNAVVTAVLLPVLFGVAPSLRP